MSELHFLQLFVVIFWIGFISAISFFESWLKFKAAGITREIGLRIGRKIFNHLIRVEWFLFIVSLFFLLTITSNGWLLLSFIALILCFQTFYLIPILNQRADKIIANQPVNQSWHHAGYVIAEILKVALLCGYAYFLAKQI